MTDIIATCKCGHQWRVSAFAVGSTGSCPHCGRVLTLSATNTAPVDFDSDAPAKAPEPIEVAPAPPRVTGVSVPGHCPQCGRAYRGDWDRIETPMGVLCNICANRAQTSSVEKTLAQQQEALVEDSGLGPAAEAPPETPEKTPIFEEHWFKQAVLIAGVGVILLGIVALFIPSPVAEQKAAEVEAARESFDERPRPGRRVDLRADLPEPTTPESGIPPWAQHMAFWGFLALGLVMEWVTLYVFLNTIEALPSEMFIGNLFGLAPMSGLNWMLGVVLVAVFKTTFLACVMVPLTYLVVAFSMWTVFNLKGWELVQFFVIRLLIVGGYSLAGFALLG